MASTTTDTEKHEVIVLMRNDEGAPNSVLIAQIDNEEVVVAIDAPKETPWALMSIIRSFFGSLSLGIGRYRIPVIPQQPPLRIFDNLEDLRAFFSSTPPPFQWKSEVHLHRLRRDSIH